MRGELPVLSMFFLRLIPRDSGNKHWLGHLQAVFDRNYASQCAKIGMSVAGAHYLAIHVSNPTLMRDERNLTHERSKRPD